MHERKNKERKNTYKMNIERKKNMTKRKKERKEERKKEPKQE